MTTAKKLLKRTAIVAGIFIGLYLLLLLVAGIYINKKKAGILTSIQTELKEQLRGNVMIGDLDISVWRYFPSIAFRLNNVAVLDSVYNKPLLSAQKISTRFNPFSLLSSGKQIKNILIENGVFHIFKDSAGYSNSYLLQPKSSTEPKQETSQPASMAIDKVSIKELAVTIEDAPGNKEISFVVNDLTAGISPDGDVLNISMQEMISMKKGLGLNLARGAYLEKQTLQANWEVQFDKKKKSITFGETDLRINNHLFVISGSFFLDKIDPKFGIAVKTKDLPYENANAILTDAIRQKTGLVQMKGPLTVDAKIEGSLLPNQEPLVEVHWKTANNTLTTAVASFTECSFEGSFMNSVNKDSAHNDPNSRITFNAFSGNWDGIKLNGKNITITNLLFPQINFDMYSNCTFEALDDKFALKDISFVSGTADVHLFYNGPMNNAMLQDLEGELHVKNGTVLYVPRNFNFTNCNGDVAFYKDSISLQKFTCNYLENKLEVSAEGKNVRRKIIGGDMSQEAMVKCYVSSKYINLEDFKPLFDSPKQRVKVKKPTESFKAVAQKLDDILVNSIIAVQVKATDVKHQHLQAKNFDADIKFLPHQWEVAKISFDLAGGTVVTKGQLVNVSGNNHNATIGVKIDHVDVKKLLYAFDNFGQDAITQQHLTGSFSTTASLKAGINQLGKIVPASIYGNMDFSLKNGSLQNFPPLANLKTFVFKNRNMTDVRFAEIKDKLDFKGMEVYVNRMEIQSTVFRLFLEGNYDLAGKNTELLVQVPLSNLNNNSFDEENTPKNKGTKAKAGASVLLRAENDEKGNVKLKLTLRKKFKNEAVQEKANEKKTDH